MNRADELKFKAALDLFFGAKDGDKPLYTIRPGEFMFPDFYQRYIVAWDFYKNAGYLGWEIIGHLKGIDFNYPPEIVPLPPPPSLQQFQLESSKYQGPYYADPGTPPEKLGITKEAQFNPETMSYTAGTVKKEAILYDVVLPHESPPSPDVPETDHRVKVLKSRVAPLINNWSFQDGREIALTGGGFNILPIQRISIFLNLKI